MYIAQIPITDVLNGAPLGERIYQAGRTLKALSARRFNGDAVLLKAHLDLVSDAKKCTAPSIHSLAPA
eukprot:9063843-Alexandrium_andersonii.AAC.1